MPFAKLTLSINPSPVDAHRLSSELTELIASELGKRRELTSVLIDVPSDYLWTIGGSRRHIAAHLEVCVTAGTNSEQEKRTFIASAMALLRRTFADLDPATYIVVNEITATDWGYDGMSQADRARQKT
ncbi:tautomerase family protein [Burkholderia sp. MR1-5-21]